MPTLNATPAAHPAPDHALGASATPAQRRLWHDVLDADGMRAARPPADPVLVGRLTAHLRRRMTGALEGLPDEATLVLSGSDLDALACDGRYLDRADSAFTWSVDAAAAALAADVMGIDVDGGRRRPVADLVATAWRRALSGGGSLGPYLDSLDPVEVDAVRGSATGRLRELREVLPELPPWMHARTGVRLAWRPHPRVVVHTRVDLAVGRVDPTRRLVHLLDVRGGVITEVHAQQRRRAALLATLRAQVAPWRVTTISLDEADGHVDEVTGDLLARAADELVDRVRRAGTLQVTRPPVARLDLTPGPWCSWCRRAPDCPLAPGAQLPAVMP